MSTHPPLKAGFTHTMATSLPLPSEAVQHGLLDQTLWLHGLAYRGRSAEVLVPYTCVLATPPSNPHGVAGPGNYEPMNR